GLSNTITATEFDISKDNSNGTVNVISGGSLSLGTASARTLLQIANTGQQTNATYSGKLDLTGATSTNFFLSSLVVGQSSGTAGVGGASGTLIATTGTVDIGGSGNTANFY